MHYAQQIFHISIIPFPRFPAAFASNQSARFDSRRSSNRLQAGGTRHESAHPVATAVVEARSSVYTNEKNVKNAFRRGSKSILTSVMPVECRISPNENKRARHVARHGKRVSTRLFVVSPSFSTKSKWIFVLFVRIPMHHPPQLWNTFRDTLRTMEERNDDQGLKRLYEKYCIETCAF